ncbi:retrovirus-related Pol polyprotein from transposon 297 [Trichonephila clavipes]|nr:retrovirus-related Pol polyprotein from transposon 297 [Trichonephila clavipes]
MRPNETVFQYLVAIRELANRGQGFLDETSIMEYCINGIPDSPSNKLILYGCTTIQEFKEKLGIYDKIFQNKSKNHSYDTSRSPNFSSQRRDVESTLHKHRNYRYPKFNAPKSNSKFENKNFRDRNHVTCFNCSGSGHISKFCPDKHRGPKCILCENFGHKSDACPQKNIPSSNNVDEITPLTTMCKEVKILSKKILSLVDTGSQVTLMKESVWNQLGSPSLINSGNILTGFGLSKTHLQNEVSDASPQPFVFAITDDIPKFDIGPEIPKQTRNDVEALLVCYRPNKIKTTDIELSITVTDDKPIYHSPRRLPFTERDIVDKQIDEWIQNGVIEPCSSAYASQVLVVRKKDGSPRVCIDFRKLNRVLVKDHYPLPLIEDILDKLQDTRVFSTIDLRNGFFHVPVNKQSRPYTSFVTQNGQFQFLKMPFGLSTCPSTFQRFINTVFRDLVVQGIVLPYMDDIVILAKNESEAIERLKKKVLQVSSDYGLEINFDKCQFLHRKIEFLGHIIENNKLFPSPSKTKSVVNYPEPKTTKEVQRFLGLTGYFRKFIPAYSVIAKPLSDLLRKDTLFNFDVKQKASFDELKRLLCQKPVLGIYRQNCETEIHTDASIDGLAAVLLQRFPDDNSLHPIYYMSRKTSETERKYTSYELEVLAIIEALKKFKVYILGMPFKIITDCNAFTKTMSKKDLNTRIARWALNLQDYDYTILHRSGSQMAHVDALSRIQSGKQEGFLHPLVKDDIPLNTYHIDHLGPLATSSKNYKFILAVIDSFTKFVWLYPTKTTSTSEVIKKLDIQKTTFGNPRFLITDRGTTFTSDEFHTYCSEQKITLHHITTGLPRANGQVERINRTIIPVLSKMSEDDPTKWFKHVPSLQEVLNSTFQRSINTTPFELLFGTQINNKTDLRIQQLIDEQLQLEFNENRELLRKAAKTQILKVQNENKKSYNLRRKSPYLYSVKDLVAIKKTQQGPGQKLCNKFIGPYKITQVKPNDTYNVEKCGNFDGPTKTSTCAEYLKPWPNK